jgi:hypothetical protein
MFLPKAIRVFSIVSFLLCLPTSHAQTSVDTLTNTNLETADLASVPAQPPVELFRVVGPLPPVVSPEQCPGTLIKAAAMKESIVRFRVQGLWPIHIECKDGTQYWGEITEIGDNSFEILNRETNEKTNLNYGGVQGVEIVKTYGVVGKYSLGRANLRQPASGQLQLNTEEASYKLALENLGVDDHRFVRCDLANGKVRTGIITEIREDGFTLRDGIFATRWIPYSQLRSSPRPVNAVGTRIGQGFKWVGLALVTIPLLPFTPLFWDGC